MTFFFYFFEDSKYLLSILSNIGNPVFKCAGVASITSINCTLDLIIEYLKDYSYSTGNTKKNYYYIYYIMLD